MKFVICHVVSYEAKTAGALMLCLEWWCFEINALFAGSFSVISLASQTLLMNAFSALYMFSIGISVAASTRVGNLLGANIPNTAWLAARVCIVFGLGTSGIQRQRCDTYSTVISGLLSLLVVLLRQYVARIYTNDQDVIAAVSYVLQISWLFVVRCIIITLVGGTKLMVGA